jgi:hypothetical protein
MRNYIKYKPQVLALFEEYLENHIDKQGLLDGLYEIEEELIAGRKTVKGLWFRLFKDSCLATTILDLANNLDCPVNGRYTKECMQLAIDKPAGLKIHFS